MTGFTREIQKCVIFDLSHTQKIDFFFAWSDWAEIFTKYTYVGKIYFLVETVQIYGLRRVIRGNFDMCGEDHVARKGRDAVPLTPHV